MAIRLVLAAALAASLCAIPADAAVSAPVPCAAGLIASDAAGDATSEGRTLPESLDITETFFRTDGSVTTAYVRVAKMSKAAPPDPTIISQTWTVSWDAAGARQGVSAVMNRAGEIEYRSSSGGVTTVTKGEVVEGAGGHVAIVLPAAIAKPGAKLTKPFVSTNFATGIASTGSSISIGSEADRAPDGAASGRDYTVADCNAPAAALAAGASTAPAVAPASKPAPAAKTLTLVGVAGKTRGRKISIRLRSSGELRRVVVTLKQGRRTVATGSLAKIDGAAVVALRAKRPFKRGTYRVFARAGGISASGKLTLK